MSNQNPLPPEPDWGSPPGSPPRPDWGPPPGSPPENEGPGAEPGGGAGWQTAPPPPSSGEEGWQTPPPPPEGQALGTPPPPAQPAGWETQEPSWAPPPPPPPRPRQAAQSGWGTGQGFQSEPSPWSGQQPAWGQPAGYGAAPGYGASAPAPAPPRRTRLWVILGAVAAVLVVVVVVGVIGVERLLNPSVPPATGATVSTKFVRLKVTSSWSETQSRNSEVELSNHGDGDMLVGYGNSGQDGITSDQSAFNNLVQNLTFNTGGPVRQCVSEKGVTIGGKSGQEEGFRYTFQGTDLCEIAWVDYVSSSRYYYWNIGDDYSRLSMLQHDDAAMQETASWKV